MEDSINILQDNSEKCKLNIYIIPNPFYDNLYIAGYARTEKSITIDLCEMSGKNILRDIKTNINGNLKLPINTSTLASGMYILSVFVDEKKYIFKVVKMVE